MTQIPSDRFSAGNQALGYYYQPRFALLKTFELPEDTSFYIEKDDDLDFVDSSGVKSLASLKHKAKGGRITDLSTDFWKSVRIWLDRYNRDNKIQCSHQYLLFTTSKCSTSTSLDKYLPQDNGDSTISEKLLDFLNALEKSKSKIVTQVKDDFEKLSKLEKEDFLSRIVIYDSSLRIEDIPSVIIDRNLRTIRTENRVSVFEQLEGWWNDLLIKALTSSSEVKIKGTDISDKLSTIAEQYKEDNLPINFRTSKPSEGLDPINDQRPFVVQLRYLGISSERIESAILDYYRAFEQRSSWMRENVLLHNEIEEYEELLVEEWRRYKAICFEALEDDSSEIMMQKLGKELYKWAEMEALHLKIRARVSEPYVVRGSFQILANSRPSPRVYWHPMFLKSLRKLLVGKVE